MQRFADHSGDTLNHYAARTSVGTSLQHGCTPEHRWKTPHPRRATCPNIPFSWGGTRTIGYAVTTRRNELPQYRPRHRVDAPHRAHRTIVGGGELLPWRRPVIGLTAPSIILRLNARRVPPSTTMLRNARKTNFGYYSGRPEGLSDAPAR
jgi:hypothetical protein